MISTFDPTFSRMSGLNTTLLHYFVMLLLSLVTVASIQTVGIILVVALLITPASTAFLISKNYTNDDYSKFNKCHKFNCRTLLQLYLQHS